MFHVNKLKQNKMKNYKGIKWVLSKQIERDLPMYWAWKQGSDEEFVCVYSHIPSWAKMVYSAQQLLDALNNR